MLIGGVIDKHMPEIMKGVAQCLECPIGTHVERGLRISGQKAVAGVVEDLMAVLFPGCHGYGENGEDRLEEALSGRLHEAASTLQEQAVHAFRYSAAHEGGDDAEAPGRAELAVEGLVSSLSEIQEVLNQDITAAYRGDPAAKSATEVVLSYPCFKAIAAHRLAHVLYIQEVPLLPRMMSEHAHSRTGIDIHPGARIGPGFFIDHGTGVVIGETCIIGKNVKIYQGVTLGALSFPKDEEGKLLKGIKRHPNVEDDVTIYSGATILGDVSIGKGTIIGGNVWLTHSVPPDSKVYNRQPTPLVRQADGKWKTAEGEWNDFGGGI
jgi:serine O-acetyltransferase